MFEKKQKQQDKATREEEMRKEAELATDALGASAASDGRAGHCSLSLTAPALSAGSQLWPSSDGRVRECEARRCWW